MSPACLRQLHNRAVADATSTPPVLDNSTITCSVTPPERGTAQWPMESGSAVKVGVQRS
ncbi:hypothetical protein ACS0TY_003810 [Phlomoides rotata]